MPKNVLHLDVASAEGPLVASLSYLGNSVLSFVTRMLGSIAHVFPKFEYQETRLANYFGPLSGILNRILASYVMQTLRQSYKVLYLNEGSGGSGACRQSGV